MPVTALTGFDGAQVMLGMADTRDFCPEPWNSASRAAAHSSLPLEDFLTGDMVKRIGQTALKRIGQTALKRAGKAARS